MSTTPEKPPRGRGEHRSVTLGDLAALVAGVAVVMALPARQSYLPYPSDFLGPWPRWLPWCFCLRQILGAACLVLVPVVLQRRACYGGLARPAEFLALCAAMPFLANSIETALIRLGWRMRSGQRLPGFGLAGMSTDFIMKWQDSLHWVWEQTLVVIGAMALLGYFLGRRKRPGWLLTAFLALAWLGAYEAGPILAIQWFDPLIARLNGRPIGQAVNLLIGAILIELPRFVLYTVPAIAAVRDVRRDGRARLTWLEWTGLGLPVVLVAITEPTELIRSYSTIGYKWIWVAEELVRAVTMVVAIILSFFLNWLGTGRERIETGHPAPSKV